MHVADYGATLDQESFLEALAKETVILQKRVDAARSRALLATSFLPNEPNLHHDSSKHSNKNISKNT